MGLFPPYNYEALYKGKQVSYGFLFLPPSYSDLDFARLKIQWVIVSVLTAGAIYSAKESKEKTNITTGKNT